jgi:uncharacterized protein DUF4136
MRIATLIGTTGLLLTTTALAQDVTYDFARATDFTAFETYAWANTNPVVDELIHQQIVHAVDVQLASKGLRQVELNASPDVLVGYHASVSQPLEVSGRERGGYSPAKWSSARTEQVMVGMLEVNIVNTRTREIVWRAAATKDLDLEASPEKRDENMNQVAQKLFQHYPPTQ